MNYIKMKHKLLQSSNYIYIIPAYIISEIAMIPLGAKLAETHGVKRTLIPASLLFTVGSMLCVVSVSVEMLTVFRFVMGLGAGLFLGMAFTSVGRYYENGTRGRCHELMTAAFALGSLFSAAIGYFLVDNFNWRMGFVVLSIAAIIGTVIAYRELPKDDGEGTKLDIVNAILVIALFGVAAFFTQEVNVDFDLMSWTSLLIIAIVIVLLFAAMYHSKISSNPLIPRGVSSMEKKMILLMFMFSMCGLGLIQYFFKLYLVYYEFDVYSASLMFLLLIAGAAGPSILGSRIVLKTGVRPWIVIGSILVAISLVLTHFIVGDGKVQFALSVFVIGIGLGCIVTQLIISLQSITPRETMGTHTGNLMATRMIGIVMGNAVVGAYIKGIKEAGHTIETIDISQVEDVLISIGERIVGDLQYVSGSLFNGFTDTVLVMAVVALLLAIVAYTLGKDDKIE